MKGKGFNFGSGGSDYSSLVSAGAQMWRMDIDLLEDKQVDLLMDIQKVGIQTETLDWIVCSEVIEHVPDFKSALKEVHRCLKQGGKLILTVPFSVPLHGEPHDYWRFTEYSLKNLASKLGFKIIEIHRIGDFRSFYWQTLALEYHRRFRWVPENLNLFKKLMLQMIGSTVPFFLAFCYFAAFAGNSKNKKDAHVLSWGAYFEKV